MKTNKPIILILCGGQSLRLWPFSQYKSKNFLDVFGFSPLELTIKRFLKLAPKENIFLVANKYEKKQLLKLKSINKKNIFFEPESKNTAAAVLLSLINLKKYSRQAVIITPVDHLITKEKLFLSAVRKALLQAKSNFIATLGIKPDRPDPNFGYIQAGKQVSKTGVYSVKRFIEKPSQKRAKKLISSGKCFYNSGMFIGKIETILAEYEKYYSDYKHFAKSIKAKKVVALYKRIKNTPFDKAIMEKTKKVIVIRGDFSWKDFGTWLSIYEVLAKDKKANASRGKALLLDSSNNLIYLDNLKKKVIALGLKDIFLIDTKDYTLLTTRSHIDSLKLVLKKYVNFL